MLIPSQCKFHLRQNISIDRFIQNFKIGWVDNLSVKRLRVLKYFHVLGSQCARHWQAADPERCRKWDLRPSVAEALGIALRYQRGLHHSQGWPDHHGQEGWWTKGKAWKWSHGHQRWWLSNFFIIRVKLFYFSKDCCASNTISLT